jgi:predicted HTH transcriptional regulator
VPSMDKLIRDTEAKLATVVREKEALLERQRDERGDVDVRLRALRASLNALTRKPTPVLERRSAAVQAGPAALAKVREVLAKGPTSQAEIARRTKLNEGTVSYALRALVEDGSIETTGKSVERSREFRLARARRVA